MAVSEVVAGRTGKRIEAAKRAQTKRLGQSGAAGKQKRCKKGKSCGATCINFGKVCLVDIPWAIGGQIAKVAKEIQGREVSAPKTISELRAKIKEHHNKLKDAAIAEDGKEYTKHRKEIANAIKELKGKGEQVPDVPLPPWSKIGPVIREFKDADAKGDSDRKDKANRKLRELLLGEKRAKEEVKLDPMITTQDFQSKSSKTSGYYNESIKNAHFWIGRLVGNDILKGIDSYISNQTFDSAADKQRFDKLRKTLIANMGKSDLEDAVKALRSFTAGGYSDIRDAQMGISRSGYRLREAMLLEKLLSMKEVPKPPVEKFRGIKVNDRTLQAMIESALAKGTYSGEALSSWSTHLGTAQNFADKVDYDRQNRVIFRTINAKGAPIGSISSFGSENEVLTPSSAKYKYLDYRTITQYGNTYHILEVEES